MRASSATIATSSSRIEAEIISASTREAFNALEADEIGCHIITAPADILRNLPAFGSKTAAELSLDGVKAFRTDAIAAGLTLTLPPRADAAE